MKVISVEQKLPMEFDLRPERRGYTMKGWDFTRAELAEAIVSHRMLNPAMELGTNICPWNCSFCFTEDPNNAFGRKQRMSNELTLEERLSLIDQAAALGARSINIVGAGEPTVDPHIWEFLERMAAVGITPILYTEGSLRLTDRDFVRRLYALGATVVVKVNSLWNAEYQNSIVRGIGAKVNRDASNYTQLRNKAIATLIEEGFADSDPTRLAFDTIVCKQNVDEMPRLHSYARANNIFVLMVGYLPSGRSCEGSPDALTQMELFDLFERLARLDFEQFGIKHRAMFPYAGGMPCSIRGMGLFIKITGAAYDCPGEMISLGNVRNERLADIWQRARPITKSFDGRCAPREEFWQSQAIPDSVEIKNLVCIRPREAKTSGVLSLRAT